jgi:hypothetical protein
MQVPPIPPEKLRKEENWSNEQPQKLVVLSFGAGADALMLSLVEFAKVQLYWQNSMELLRGCQYGYTKVVLAMKHHCPMCSKYPRAMRL